MYWGKHYTLQIIIVYESLELIGYARYDLGEYNKLDLHE